jgi:Fur family ferric uptake transcriptional regulator
VADDLLDRLREVGLRATTPRRVIVEALLAQPDHITAEDLTALVQAGYPEVHRATVYRTLEALADLGAVYRMPVAQGPAQWHLTERSHQHLVCDECGRVQEVSAGAFARLAAALARDYGFEADIRHVAMTGRCDLCAGRA